MTADAVLGLIGDLYSQITQQKQQIDALRVENARLEALLPRDAAPAPTSDD